MRCDMDIMTMNEFLLAFSLSVASMLVLHN